MKSRETFYTIRNKTGNKLSLRVRLTIMVSAEIVVSVILSLWASTLIDRFSPVKFRIPLILELIVLSLLIGAIVTGFMSKLFFDPIKKLCKAMERVADGDFKVRLETNSSSKEIQEIYSGFNLMTHELDATEILQTDFVSNVSHEFKTPISAIEGYATLLSGCENLDDEQKQYVDKITFNTKRLSGLVGNILLLSKLDNQSIQTKHDVFRLDEQIRQSIVMLEPKWEEKNIEFDVEMESVEYIGNETIMHHIWDNLIGNAVKFSPKGGLISIRLFKSGEQTVFTVSDEGPGIPEDVKKHIFDKFYQADSSHKQEGNGLGLALVKRILAISGGEIQVDNLTDTGCRFTVALRNK